MNRTLLTSDAKEALRKAVRRRAAEVRPSAQPRSAHPAWPGQGGFDVRSFARVTNPEALYGGRDPADVPAYRLPEAASMVGLPTSTLRSWVRGRSFPLRDGQGRSEPIIIAPDDRALSFTNVVEAHVLAAMRRRYDLDLDTIRRAVR